MEVITPLEIKETSILLTADEIIKILGICEDADKERALNFLKMLKAKIERVQGSFRSSYQRGGHIGVANLK